MLGGHWLVLQSVAWTRMLAEFSKQESLPAAISKTFDGQHPCPMCLKIRAGRQQEERQPKNAPLTKIERLPDWTVNSQVFLDFVPAQTRGAVLAPPPLHADFIDSPPTPPPRGSLAAL